MKVGIIGAGFSGLATAWHLLARAPCFPVSSLTIFDSKGIGGGASGMAAGLLHPYAGAHAKFNRLGKEGMEATLKLLDEASKALDQQTILESGLLRLAFTTEQIEDFKACKRLNEKDVDWLEADACQRLYPFLPEAPGLWIKQGYAVNAPLYLQGLWKACFRLGASLETTPVSSLDDLQEFDLKIIAAGADSLLFPELASCRLSATKGQILELEWPSSLPPLPFPLNSQAYLLMNPSKNTCLAGSTFEKDFFSIEPDLEKAKKDILPKACQLLPSLEFASIKSCQAGLRVSAPDHLPLIKQIKKGLWLITGMGSKGLLYHALMAQRLVESIWADIHDCEY